MLKAITLVNFVPSLTGNTTLPLGPLYITSVLEQAGCEVDFRDYQMAPYRRLLTRRNMLDFLSDSRPALGISCFFNTLPFILPCLQMIKAESPEKTIILGGAGPSSVAEKLIRRFPFIDLIVRGEGENTVLDLANGVPYADIAGIVYRREGDVVVNPLRERIRHLDCLPLPAYHKISIADYAHVGVIAARGCPYHCSFCEVAPLWGRQTEQRSASNVVSEIKLLHERYGVRSIRINDDTFVLDRSWVLDFCRAIKSEQLDITWRCMGRINLMDEDLLAAMVDAGCVGIQYGVESGSESVLKRIGKQISVPQAQDVIEMSVRYLEHVVTTFMWGFPFESMEDFYETLYFMGKVAEAGASIKLLLLSPSPLSQVYQEYAQQLRFSEKRVSNLLQGGFENEIAPEEKDGILGTILQNPDVFPGFFYVDAPDIEKKFQALETMGLI
jgi:anaerobic magnesium-protoporphyrin IX monomethyl ester cyclase